MKTFKHFVNWIKSAKGSATSLTEATVTIAIGAVLATVAVGGGVNELNDSKVLAAAQDVAAIGESIITFYKDNNFYPMFVNGSSTGPSGNYFGFLVSESGTYPTDTTNGFGGTGYTWQIPQNPVSWGANPVGAVGNKPDYATGQTGHGTIEGQLIEDVLSDPTAPGTAAFYPRRGSILGAPQQGWHGPYVQALPKQDPWGNKYMVNIQYLSPAFQKTYTGTNPNAPNLPSFAVVVLSAGPNLNIDTPVDQPYAAFQSLGDDIVFRIN